MLNQFGEAVPEGLRIRGLLEHEVEGIRSESKTFEEMVKNTINLWLWKDQSHLNELMLVLQDCAKRRAISNPKGMSSTKSFGTGISIPTGLYMALDKVIPDIFENKKKLNLFKKSFPQFKTY